MTTEPSPSPRPRPDLDDPRLAAFLPLFYVAWADGELSDDEIAAIGERAQAVEGLDDCCGGAFAYWLDPGRPPTARDLGRLLASIRRQSEGLSRTERRSLAELGVELARQSGHQPAAAEIQALERIEGALGLPAAEASRGLLAAGRPQPEPAAEEPTATFDPAAMTRVLDRDHHELRDEIRRFLAAPEMTDPPPGERYTLPVDEYRQRVLGWCKLLADRGYGSLALPAEAGGRGDLGAFIAAFETLAFGDLSLLVKFGVQFGLFAGSVHQLGTESHHRRFLPAAGRLDLPGCFAMSETGHGSNVADVETTATFDPASGDFVVHSPRRAARKDWIGNAALHGRIATVFAQLEIGDERHGVHALLVPIRGDDGKPLPGVEIEDCGPKLGLQGVDNGRLLFDRVRVPRENLLDRFAQVSAEGEYTSPIVSPSKRFFTMLGTLVGGRISVAKASLSASKAALAIAVGYALRRRQFGSPGEPEVLLLDYLTHQRRLLPRLATSYALSFALHDLARRYVDSEVGDRRDVEASAAGLKAFATWHATDTIQECREACGGQGYLTVNRFAALKADTDVFTTFEGDNTVLLQLLAKNLLSGYKQQFGGLGLVGVTRYLAGRAATAVAELNPVVTRNSDREHLRSREFHRAAFRWREDHLVSTVAARLKKRLDAGMDSQQALIECQDHLISAAKAHVGREVLEAFDAALVACEDPDLAAVLSRVCDLFALSRIELDRGWFLEHGYIENGKSKAIRAEVNALCGELRPQAGALVDAFAVPGPWLAPIAEQLPPLEDE